MSTTQSLLNRLPRHAVFVSIMLILLGCGSADVPDEPKSAPETQHAQTVEAPQQAQLPAGTEAPARLPIEVTGDRAAWQSIYFGAADGLNLELPPGWDAAVLDAVAIQAGLAAADGSTAFDVAASEFVAATADTTTVIAAIYTGSVESTTVQPRLTIALIPRHGIALDQYVEGLSGRLSSVEDLEVERAGLLYDVRGDGLPVGMVAYHRSKPGEADMLSAYHLAQLDEGGDNLVTMTWVGTPADLYLMLSDFHATAASLTSNED